MKKLLYFGEGTRREEAYKNLPVPNRVQLANPSRYTADPGLVDAANVALLLGQPLLLTGEAGTGKTQLAYSLAWELGLDEPFKFETKSNSMARDLFYTYDALRRFQDAQSDTKPENILPYLTYQALGIAILRSRLWEDNANLVEDDSLRPAEPTRSLVLIDEIDKAPRDFPNDILNEIENMYFRIPEMGNLKVEADPKLPPIVVITSNSEKDLPDAFLRRCVYYNVPFPDKERLRMIVSNRLGMYVGGSNRFIDDALDLFFALREDGVGLRKKPSTAEMLGWLLALKDMSSETDNPLADGSLVMSTLSVLIKNKLDENDQKNVTEAVDRWLMARPG
jgi:MoxR-like ATPase